MKAIKRIIIWILISIIGQVAVLFYVNNYLFASEDVSGSIVSKKVENVKEREKKNVDIIIPKEAKNVALSFDGSYVAYYKDDVFNVVDVYTGDEKRVDLEDKLKVSFFKWAPDRNIIMISAKKEYNSNAKFLFYSYDAERDMSAKLETKEEDETAFVTSKTSEVEDIQLSPFTNMTYIKTALNGGRSSIHSINIMKRINKVDTQVYFIGDIRITPNDDRIAYEANTKNKVYITGKTKPISVEGVDKLALIDVDDNDNIYVGEVEETQGSTKIKNIFYGTINDDSSQWKTLSLTEPVNKKDIFISRNGSVYINDDLKGIVTELKSGKQTKYKGIFLQMYNGGVSSISDEKLLQTALK